MSFLVKALLITSTLILGTSATLPTSYDVAWTTPGVNGSADSMPLGGGDIGINTWFEDGTFFSSIWSMRSKLHELVFAKVSYLVLLFLQRMFRVKLELVVPAYEATVCGILPANKP
jgi:hypothetical protein